MQMLLFKPSLNVFLSRFPSYCQRYELVYIYHFVPLYEYVCFDMIVKVYSTTFTVGQYWLCLLTVCYFFLFIFYLFYFYLFLSCRKVFILLYYLRLRPVLLPQFAPEARKSRSLVQIPQYFDMEKYAQNRAILLRTIDLLRDIFLLHADSALLEECMASFYFYTSSELAFTEEVVIIFFTLLH